MTFGEMTGAYGWTAEEAERRLLDAAMVVLLPAAKLPG